jgi:cytochrome c-type biogenesis protein CcmH/NrfF
VEPRGQTLSALRLDIRTLITDGRVDAGVMEFMVSRCGDFVRYLLPLKGTTLLLLWFGPGVLFVLVPLPAAAGDHATFPFVNLDQTVGIG